MIQAILNALNDKNSNFGLQEIISWLDKHPEVKNLNSHIKPNQGWDESLEQDKKLR